MTSFYEHLPQSYKKHFPFRIAAPSFIYPADWVDNIRMLGPFLDEIEILLFDSAHEEDFPTATDIDRMASLAEEFALTYNIHLPTDVYPGSGRQATRQRAIDRLIRVYKLTAPLNPTAFILHLPLNQPVTASKVSPRWLERTEASVETLLVAGIPAGRLCVENINYPFEWVAPIIEQFDLGVCLDLGHLLVQAVDWQTEYQRWSHRTEMIHLHGVDGGRDHLRLNRLSSSLLIQILRTLDQFTGTISVEVFSFHRLKQSLAYLADCHQNLTE